MSIITKGYGSKNIVTQGYGGIGSVIVEIIRREVIRLNSFMNRIIELVSKR